MSNTSAVPLHSAAMRSAASRARSATSSCAPSSAKRRQRAAPMAPPPPVTSTLFPARPFIWGCLLAFWSLVDHALRLADRALDRAEADLGADAHVRLDVVLQLRRRGRVAFDDDGEVVERPLLGELEHVVRAEPRLLQDQLLDLRREDVDPSYDQHVVGAAGDLLHAPHAAR